MGWAQPIGGWVEPHDVIALIVDKNFPFEEANHLIGGVIARRPMATWVVRQTDRRARDLLLFAGVDPVLAPLSGYWKLDRPPRPEAFEPDLAGDSLDLRARWRDGEILSTCELVLVAVAKGSKSMAWWTSRAPEHPNMRVAIR